MAVPISDQNVCITTPPSSGHVYGILSSYRFLECVLVSLSKLTVVLKMFSYKQSCINHPTHHLWPLWFVFKKILYSIYTWAATWTNKQSECVPSEDLDQPGHPPSLIRVFAVRMKKTWALSYPLSAKRRLWSDWADAQADLSLRWAHAHFVGFVMSLLNWWLACSW